MHLSRIGRAVAVAAMTLAAGLAVAAPASAAPEGKPRQATPTIYALPDSDLVDGQQIYLILRDFPPNHVVGVTECGIPTGFPEVCDFGNGFNVTTNKFGVAITKFTVRQNWTGTDPWTGEVLTDVDCKVTQCTAAAASPTQPTTGDIVPIHFR